MLPPHPVQKANRALTIVFALVLATATVAAQAEGQIDYRATAQAPVHLMRNSNGAAFTAVLDQHPVSGELRLKKRPVTPPEIARLEAQGVTLAYLPDPEEAQPPEATWSAEPHKVGSPAPSVPRNFTLHANTNQWVAYWIARNGQTFFTADPVITSAQRPTFDPTKGGVLFTVMGTAGPDFTLSFRNVFTGRF